jgi:hypothetical protein
MTQFNRPDCPDCGHSVNEHFQEGSDYGCEGKKSGLTCKCPKSIEYIYDAALTAARAAGYEEAREQAAQIAEGNIDWSDECTGTERTIEEIRAMQPIGNAQPNIREEK